MRKLLTLLFILVAFNVYALRVEKPSILTDLSEPDQVTTLNEILERFWNITNGRLIVDDDEKVKVDVGATSDYLGAAANDGALRVTLTDGLTWADGGNYVTLGLDMDYADVSGNDGATDVTAAQLEELSDASTTDLHAHDYANISGADGATDVTAAELEELTDASVTALQSHAGGGSLSNVVFCFGLSWNWVNNIAGMVVQNAAVLTDTPAVNNSCWAVKGTTHRTVLISKYKHSDDVTTITYYAYIVTSQTNQVAYCNVDVGGQNSTTNNNSEGGAWKTNTIDVSGLTDGTVYDITVQLWHASASYTSGLVSLIGITS